MNIESSPVQTTTPLEPGKRYFTIAQANDALPYVRRVVDDITRLYAHIMRLRKQLNAHDTLDHAKAIDNEYDHAMDRLGELVDELQLVGVDLKDFERGLVDFPSIHQDREILLCWQRGEPNITHWHETDAGFAGRHPIDQLD